MGWELSWRVSGRATAESLPWVPYESALAGAPGTGGWGEQFPLTRRNQVAGALGLPPLPSHSVLGWGCIFRGLWGWEDRQLGQAPEMLSPGLT